MLFPACRQTGSRDGLTHVSPQPSRFASSPRPFRGCLPGWGCFRLSPEGGFEVHGQDGGANPHLRTLHTMVSDTVQPAVVLSVAEGTLNTVALPLLFLEPAFRGFPVVFRTTLGFEGGADSPLLHQPAPLPGSARWSAVKEGGSFPNLCWYAAS